eukprot:759754-Hanusia_phi.AAC.1
MLQELIRNKLSEQYNEVLPPEPSVSFCILNPPAGDADSAPGPSEHPPVHHQQTPSGLDRCSTSTSTINFCHSAHSSSASPLTLSPRCLGFSPRSGSNGPRHRLGQPAIKGPGGLEAY